MFVDLLHNICILLLRRYRNKGNHMSTKYCNSCEDDATCPNFHAYIIELDRSVLDETNFPYEGELPLDKKVFYVGQTNHSVECRYFQHTAHRSEDNQYDCTCNLGVNPNNKIVRRSFPKRVTYVNRKRDNMLFAKELFAPNLFNLNYNNPTVIKAPPGSDLTYIGSAKDESKKSEEIETAIGEQLRSMGHAVYWN